MDSHRQFDAKLVTVHQPALRLLLPSPMVELCDERLTPHGVRILLKRDDLIHPELPGNKWRKLKYNLSAATEQRHGTLLTFGGAYSNHIRATAAAGYYLGFATIGVIRGEQHLPLNPSLAYAVSRGMRLTYLDRTTYRAKDTVIHRLRRQFGDFYLLPEGGSNELAVRGCVELGTEIGGQLEPGQRQSGRHLVICCPVGTGGTLAGLAAGLPASSPADRAAGPPAGPPAGADADQRALGFSVLKGAQFLADDVRSLQHRTFGAVSRDWSIEHGFHCGGYAKTTPALEAFRADFATRHEISLDRVYVAKMMLGIFSLVARGAFTPGTTVVAVLTGAADPGEPGNPGKAG